MRKRRVNIARNILLTCMLWVAGTFTALAQIQAEVEEIEYKLEDKLSQVNIPSANDSVKSKSLLKWIIKNWSAKDNRYCLDAFYNWSFQLQDNLSQESLRIVSPEGFDIKMRSRLSNKLGPYFGYRWLVGGLTFDFLGRSNGRKRNEFSLDINSQLFNIEIINRHTGGDFRLLNYQVGDGKNHELQDYLGVLKGTDMGDRITYRLAGVNINMFTNHKKFSNPAGFSNGAIQLRSAGSPIVGIGYTRQKMNTDAPLYLADTLMSSPQEFSDKTEFGLLFSPMASSFTINDLHVQLGYAYNLVLSRRLLVSFSVIASIGHKWVNISSDGSLFYQFLKDEMGDLHFLDNQEWFTKTFKEMTGKDYKIEDYGGWEINRKSWDLNTMIRAGITYNHNRWRAGVGANLNHYYYHQDGFMVDNSYWNARVYVGYTFGRKKKFRYGGEARKEYVRAALDKKDIEAVNDTLLDGNLGMGEFGGQRTSKYHEDKFVIQLHGCDLAKGPDGYYGTFELEDGYISQGQDSQNLQYPGLVLPIDADGAISVSVGHNQDYRTGNWWKKQLKLNQTLVEWYPDRMYYALKGKLTLYLRGKIFGTRKPVKFVLDDFYIGRGRDMSSYDLFGSTRLKRRSTYSLSGQAVINGRTCRLYLDSNSKYQGMQLTISRVKEGNSHWMSTVANDKPLSKMCIPGTHDSGTSTVPESQIYWTAHTQNFPVIDQTYDGIRAFDIRLKEDMSYGHTFKCKETYTETLQEWEHFLQLHPSECIIAMIGSDEGGHKWSPKMIENYQKLIKMYPHRFVEKFDANTTLGEMRGKILVIKRQEECPFGKLLKFEDNAIFSYDCFHVADEYKEFKTWKKLAKVEQHLRDAYEQENQNLWYITFNSVSWSPRRHSPYQYAQGAHGIRKPLNQSLYELIELKDYNDFGIIMMDFYNDKGQSPKLVDAIIEANSYQND